MKRRVQKIGLRVMPKRTFTHLIGTLARSRISQHLIPIYVKHYQIDASEAEKPLGDYRNLTDFFARRLKPGVRPLSRSGVTSPVDGTVSELGTITSGTLVQAKGSTYTVEALLGDKELALQFEGGTYITIYLSPKDYHRIHMPIDGRIVAWRYIPGSLYPVNQAGVTNITGLFARNERLVSLVSSEHGNFAFINVGATIVGSIRSEYGPEYSSPFQTRRRTTASGVTNLSKSKGDEVGYFEFGSTVILIFENKVISSFSVKTGDRVRMGQKIATLTGESL